MANLDDLYDRAHAAPLGATMEIDATVVIELLNELHAAHAAVRLVARAAVGAVEASGQVITVERRPLVPLAMGHHTPIIHFQPKRGAI